jgi:hypothetical protein
VLGGEFLDRSDDDPGTALNGLLELARRAVDLPHHATGLLELRDGALKLAVEHDAVGDDDRRVENRLVGLIMQVNCLMRGPADRVGFSRTGGVLDQIVAARSVAAGIRHYPPHRIQLLEAREDHGSLTVVTLLQMDETANHVEQDLAGKDRAPIGLIGVEIGDPELARDVRVAASAIPASIERQKPGLAVHEARGH